MNRVLIFKVKLREKELIYNILIPTAGQAIRIENAKAIYSYNNYSGIMSQKTVGANYALDIVDMNAYISILCPKLIEDLEIDGKNLLDLDVFDLQTIKKAYMDQFVPWVNEWQSALMNLNIDQDKDEKESNE